MEVRGSVMKDAVGSALRENLKWVIVVAHTTDGWEVVVSSDEEGNEFDILRMSQEFQLAIKGLTYMALKELEDIAGDAGEANKEETP